MQVTINGSEHTLKRPYLRVALMLAGAIAEVIPDDAKRDDEGSLLDEEVPIEFGVVAAAAAGICLPKEVGSPRFKSRMSVPALLEYGNQVDVWGYANCDDYEEWGNGCNEALTLAMSAVPSKERQDTAADPTEAHTGAPSPA